MRTKQIRAKIFDAYDIDDPIEITKEIYPIEWTSIRHFDKEYISYVQQELSKEIFSFISTHLNNYLIKDLKIIFEKDGQLECHAITQESAQHRTDRHNILIKFDL